ncbi:MULTISPECIES: ACT domain-containing protein [unclassified Erysipelothrix]|uniref:ACT domain-containing protein n=1 Tax=unclassified Erysipelothrix TaxID=2624170 RepID=UPI0013785C2D|nr:MULTISPECIES: ACT domain-containing protein [unclassified Erysipelothrix]MBK2402488.1 ACT domain-containing protein [Erysipelothrix sp. strain 2 (EsS2-6-Brazil)]MBK2403377.1 ACT domain-containing protein [Erysipelothrix sp. strain 2 (EsS2-7-Brazil)]NBA00655.1 ACT domain-containing protein [Erysipelothrix rhusiopathiae]
MKAIITVVGKDNVGIISGVCNYLAQENINVLDINQTIVDAYFNMLMIVDLSQCLNPFDEVSLQLQTVANTLGVVITMQREDIFSSMHRI